MLRILNSNQPVAWIVVPISGFVLFLMACSLGLCEGGSWTAIAAIILTARLLHLMHAESGMRTRPGSIPGWVWVLFAAPFIGVVPDASWWSVPCFVQGLRMAMRLRDMDGMSGTFLAIGMWWGMGLLVESALWPFALALVVGVSMGRRPDAGEGLSGLIGMLAPLCCVTAVFWLWDQQLVRLWTYRSLRGPIPTTGLIWWVIPVGAGWVMRQQSLVRATAQQRFSRQMTQWAGAFAVLLTGMTQLLHWAQPDSWPSTSAGAPVVLAFVASWSLPWLMPPGFRSTKVMPFVFILMSLAILALRCT